MTKQTPTPWYAWPFVALWKLVSGIVTLTGRLVAVVLGLALLIVGIACALALACKDVPMYPPEPEFQKCVKTIMAQLSGPDALTASLSIRECGLSATSCTKLRQCALKGAAATACDGVALESDTPIGKCDMDARAITCWR